MNRPLKVLVVEDSITYQQFLDCALKTDPSVQVWTAESVTVAIQLLSWQKFDVITLDLFLPDYEGLIGLKKIRGITDLPIVIVSGTDPSLENDTLMEGAQDFLVKGTFSDRQLLASIRHAVMRHERVKLEVEQRFAEVHESLASTEAVEKKAEEVEAKYGAIVSGR